MRRSALLTLLTAVLTLVGCNDTPENKLPENLLFTIDTKTLEIPSEGGSAQVTITSNYKWTLEGTSDWCTPSVTSGEACPEGQIVTFTAHQTFEDREMSFIFKCGDKEEYLDVRQNRLITIDFGESDTFYIGGLGGDLYVEYTSTVLCDIVIPDEAAEWLSIIPGESTRSSLIAYSVHFYAPVNDTGEQRSTSVKFAEYGNSANYREITIVQHPRYRIEYTTTDGKMLKSYDSAAFGATMVSNNYEDGVGWLEFAYPPTIIKSYAFTNSFTLATITIPETVEKIENFAFNNCPNIREFKGKFATADGRCLLVDTTIMAFAPGGLSKYSIAEGVQRINHAAFWPCPELEEVTIPASVTYIGYYAFQDCTKLAKIYCKGTTPPEGGTYMFFNHASSRKIYVPSESVDAYKSAEFWSDYADAIVGYDF